jgi:hypothetical protein
MLKCEYTPATLFSTSVSLPSTTAMSCGSVTTTACARAASAAARGAGGGAGAGGRTLMNARHILYMPPYCAAHRLSVLWWSGLTTSRSWPSSQLPAGPGSLRRVR